ncbi:unnamed protein product [Heligmosomoides polygyrus]|uniref:TAZ-type domain-containing protein n=1 Tax=Heligmosomoides polygyrus TaxID=6339 RepID=A0A183GA93_HELPZ|nr:unnamed protein product [Heligmosomoides polygyrus]
MQIHEIERRTSHVRLLQRKRKHYSDACPEIHLVNDRTKLLENEGRCTVSVEIRAGICRKKTSCFYCEMSGDNRERICDHHGSICPKSEEYVGMLKRRNELKRTIEKCKKTLKAKVTEHEETQTVRAMVRGDCTHHDDQLTSMVRDRVRRETHIERLRGPDGSILYLHFSNSNY